MSVASNSECARVGSSVAAGIAIGRAVLWAADPERESVAGTIAEERVRLDQAIAEATRGLDMLVGALPAPEADLFLPEVAMLAELGPLLRERVEAGATAETAIDESTSVLATDLLVDARARLLDALVDDPRSVEKLLDERDGDRVLVTSSLTPSVVAVLPRRVVGIVAASGGAAQDGRAGTSHAVILARGRNIAVAFVPSDVVASVADDELVILDTTESVAYLSLAPNDALVALAEQKRAALLLQCRREAELVAAPLLHLGIEVNVNVGSIDEPIPAAAEGIGLLRTELVFSSRSTAPSEADQFDALCAIAAPLGRAPVVVRLFDAGGDKLLSWLRAPADQPLARGIALLLLHPVILETQLRAILHAAEHIEARILLPLVTRAFEVERIRTLSARRLAIGAMIETPDAVHHIDELAAAADFICIGTNDLFALVSGRSRAYDSSYDARGLGMVEHVIQAAHARMREVSVCGEMAGDPDGARILVGLGVDAISVATSRFARVKLSVRDVSLDDCRLIAQRALEAPPSSTGSSVARSSVA